MHSFLKALIQYMMFCAIWYHFYNLKNVESTHGGVLLLVILKVTLLHGCFFTLLKLYKWDQIAQDITYCHHMTLKKQISGKLTQVVALFNWVLEAFRYALDIQWNSLFPVCS